MPAGGYNPPWTQAEIDEALRLKNEGKSYREIGAQLGFTRNAVGGQLWRLRHGVSTPPSERVRVTVRKSSARGNLWTEAKLTETWEARKRRRALERVSAKPSS